MASSHRELHGLPTESPDWISRCEHFAGGEVWRDGEHQELDRRPHLRPAKCQSVGAMTTYIGDDDLYQGVANTIVQWRGWRIRDTIPIAATHEV
jgi:hypothetical protein